TRKSHAAQQPQRPAGYRVDRSQSQGAAPPEVQPEDPTPNRGEEGRRQCLRFSPGLKPPVEASGGAQEGTIMASHKRFFGLLLFGALALGGWLATVQALEPEHGTLAVTCLEIPDIQRGAGLAVVLQTPGGKTYLYDTGSGYPHAGGWAGDYN